MYDEDGAETLSINEAVEIALPYDGPHTSDSITDAAGALNQITRYLNNATQPYKKSLEWASTTHNILNSLASTAAKFDQLLDQLEKAMVKQSQGESLYDDRYDRAASDTALETASAIAHARPYAAGLAATLSQASSTASHLGNKN